jgi:SAM-dependent methyltransferase
MLGMNLFKHYKNNLNQWRYFKSLPKSFQAESGYFPSEPYYKYHPNNDFGGKKTLNFGCGKSVYKAPNVFNVDIAPGDNVIVRDHNKSLSQFGTDFEFILANHVLEHVPNWFETLKEMAEILKPGGQLEIFVPPVSSDTAFTFRDHINRIGLRSFDGVGPNPTAGANLTFYHEYKTYKDLTKLKMVEYNVRPCVKWWTMLAWPSLLKFMIQHLRNIASEERYLFVKLP